MKKLLAIALTPLMLVSGIGLTIARHYCGGRPAEQVIALGHSQVGCGMERVALPQSSAARFSVPPCCEDRYQSIEVSDRVETPSDAFQAAFFMPAIFEAAFTFSVATLGQAGAAPRILSPPPLGPKNWQAIFQSFLI